MKEFKAELFQLQKRIAIVISSLGFIVSIINFLYRVSIADVYAALTHDSFLIVFAACIVIFTTGFIRSKAVGYIQVVIGFIGGAMAIMDSYDSIYGIGLFLLFSMVAYKYELYGKFTVIKIILEIAVIYTFIIFSARNQLSATRIMLGLDALLYITIFLVILFILYSHEIKSYINKTRAAEETISELEEQRLRLNVELEVLNSKIDNYNNKNELLDFNEHNITMREQDVIRQLVIYKNTQKEIADKLNISPETVKTHLKHIRVKLGVERQAEIIDMCRNNFIMEGKKL